MINPAVSQELVIFITIGFDGVNILGMEGLFQAQECEEEENLFHIWLYYSSYDIICFLSGLSVCQFLFQLIFYTMGFARVAPILNYQDIAYQNHQSWISLSTFDLRLYYQEYI
jgi:hypothetical protein